MEAVNVAVVGPGAMGCFLAARFAAAGVNVLLVDRNPVRAETLRTQGVWVESGEARQRFSIPVDSDPKSVAAASFCCFCVKSFDTSEAVGRLAPELPPDCILVTMQNGLGNAEELARLSPRSPVVCATIACGVTLVVPGRIRTAGAGPVILAPFQSCGRESADRFCGLLKTAGFEVEVCEDADSILWSKLVVNAAINPVAALADVANGGILDRADLREMAFSAAAEAAGVARAKGIRLRFESAAGEVTRVCEATRGNICSMAQDLRRQHRTEVETITGAVVREGRRLGLSVPINERLLAGIRQRESLRGTPAPTCDIP